MGALCLAGATVTPPIAIGTEVRVRHDPSFDERYLSDTNERRVQHNAQVGTVVAEYLGPSYAVEFSDGEWATFEPEELS